MKNNKKTKNVNMEQQKEIRRVSKRMFKISKTLDWTQDFYFWTIEGTKMFKLVEDIKKCIKDVVGSKVENIL